MWAQGLLITASLGLGVQLRREVLSMSTWAPSPGPQDCSSSNLPSEMSADTEDDQNVSI